MMLGRRTVLPLLLASCSADPAPPTTMPAAVVKSSQRYTREYVLQPGDQIEITVFQVPDLSKTVTVRPDGFISLPILKDVRVGDLTVPDLNKELTRLYSERLVKPDVTVNVLNPRAASVFVLGEVQRPGPVPIRDAPTAAYAIAASGGATRTASLDKVAVIRLGSDGVLTGTVIERNYSGDAAFYMALSGMALESGDLVVVPESGRSQFVRFVQDFVNTPLTGVNQALTPYYQFRLLSLIRTPN